MKHRLYITKINQNAMKRTFNIVALRTDDTVQQVEFHLRPTLHWGFTKRLRSIQIITKFLWRWAQVSPGKPVISDLVLKTHFNKNYWNLWTIFHGIGIWTRAWKTDNSDLEICGVRTLAFVQDTVFRVVTSWMTRFISFKAMVMKTLKCINTVVK